MSAVISPCGTYRYRLNRHVSGIPGARKMAFIMVNPSTADAVVNDATIRKCTGFALHHGYGRIIVGNKFAFRSKDVVDLRSAADPIGPENDDHIEQIILDADIVVAAWGTMAKLSPALRNRWWTIQSIINNTSKKFHCFGTGQDGHPRHPLMLGYDTPLVKWIAP